MLLAFALMSSTPFFMGCSSDKDIDLGDLDQTIGIGGDNLNIPLGAARDLKLADVLSLKEGDVIETLDKDSAGYLMGDYQFKKGDDLDPADVKVKEVHFDTFDPTEFTISVPFDEIKQGDNDDQEYAFPIEGPAKINEFDVTGQGNDDVVSLKEADLEGFFMLDLGLSQLKNEVEFTQIDIYIPRFLDLDTEYIKSHHDFIEGSVDFRLADPKNGTNEDEKYFNLLTLNKVNTSKERPVALKVKRVDEIVETEPTDPDEIGRGYMVFNKQNGLKLHGVVKMRLRFIRHYVLHPESTTSRIVDPSISMDSGINVTHAEGIFDPEININPSNVAIGDDVPDFLTDDDVNITMNNPTIKLKIESNINAKANIRPKMIAYFDDAKTDSLYMYIRNMVNGQEILPSIYPNTSGNDSKITTSYIIITRNDMSDQEAQAISNATGYTVERFVMNDKRPELTKKDINNPDEVIDIAQLLHPHIPKSIEFKIEAWVDQDSIARVDLYDENDPNSKGGDYHITPSYEFISPLALDPGSTIVYNDTIADWNKDIKDKEIELYEGDIIVTGNIHNNTPMELTLQPVAIGVDKQDISSDVTVESHVVAASNLGEGTENVTPIKITLKRTPNGSFQKLDGLAIKVVCTSASTATLNKDTQSIQITDLKLNLKGKVSVSL